MEIDFQRIESRYRFFPPTLRYCMEVEAHVYAFSVAANVLLSFFPFLIVLVSLCRYVLFWKAGEQAIYVGLRDFFPGETGEFLVRNLTQEAYSHWPFQWMPILLLLFTANGIFEPLEVALNRAWGIGKNRPYWRNQLVSLGLIFACGILAMLSTGLTATNRGMLTPNLLFKLAAFPATIGILFLVYWLLPNGKVPWPLALRTSIVVAFGLEALKYLNLLISPWLYGKLKGEYGPFVNSATLILWSFFGALIVMAGAEWAARRERNRDKLLA